MVKPHSSTSAAVTFFFIIGFLYTLADKMPGLLPARCGIKLSIEISDNTTMGIKQMQVGK
ncbi:hypothetical protein GCM10011500_41890 [Mucilaginibacter rubeus]|nr:hypothetical protein GCM10011500_41890 [Mucilaginibacter rubeus]